MPHKYTISFVSKAWELFILITLPIACHATGGEKITQHSDYQLEQQYFPVEIKKISSSTAKNRNHVYFVKIADGYIPIPDRFTLHPSKNSPDMLSKVHAALIAGDIITRESFTRGFINLGEYSAYLSNILPRYKNSFDFYEKEYGNLNVVVMTEKLSENSWLKPTRLILLHDKKHYLLIGDENENLWEAMLAAYKNNARPKNVVRPFIASVADDYSAKREQAESQAKAEYPRQEYYKNELLEIENPTSNNAKHVFFIKLGGGYIPIPNRFIINPNIKSGDPSVSITLVSRALGDSTLGSEGSITIGDYGTYKRLLRKQKSRHVLFDTEETQHGKLKVIRMIEKLRSPTSPPTEITIFHDDKYYVFLHDRNRKLWKYMIHGYENTIAEIEHIRSLNGKTREKTWTEQLKNIQRGSTPVEQ